MCSTVLSIRGAGMQHGVLGRGADVKSMWVGLL